ncbi:MAG: hypothetical protein JWO05_974 [Gemmatimonadetes bacterium]|nr:hypothetical protein [Gemmatimonadota bacterium]
MTSVTEFLDYLDKVHARTRRIVLLAGEDDLEWLPGPGRFTFGDSVRHLAGIERWMYAETVHDRPNKYPGHDANLAPGAQATLEYYDTLHAESRAQFALLTDERMGERCLTPGDAKIPVWKWLRALFEHEAHHRGQMYMILGLRGVPTPPIFGLPSEALIVNRPSPRAQGRTA